LLPSYNLKVCKKWFFGWMNGLIHPSKEQWLLSKSLINNKNKVYSHRANMRNIRALFHVAITTC
jgi:hypothetical protein